jgi:hypothetical protein
MEVTPTGPVQEAGKYVADMILDGDAADRLWRHSDAVVMQLTHKHDLGVHTEMIGDGIMTLVESRGDQLKKNHLPARWLPLCALGLQGCTDFAPAIRRSRCTRSTFTNDLLAGWPERQPCMPSMRRWIDPMGQSTGKFGARVHWALAAVTDFRRPAV